MEDRVVLLFASEHAGFAKACATVANVVGVVFEQRSFAVKRDILVRRLKRFGTWHTLGQLGHRFVRRLLSGAAASVPVVEEGFEIPLSRCSDINDASTVDFLARVQPDVVIVYGSSILRRPLLQALPAKTFNIHTGLTQYYRGTCSSFWALYEGCPERLGVTIHRVSHGVDTGEPVAFAQPKSEELAQARSLDDIDRIMARLGEGVALEILAGERKLLEELMTTRGRLFSEPTLWQYLEFCRLTRLR